MDTLNEKTCQKCKKSKNKVFFYKNNSKKDKLASCCKDCSNVYDRNCKKINKEKIIDMNINYYKKNRDKIILNVKKYYENNKEKVSEKNKKYLINNKEKINLFQKKYRTIISDCYIKQLICQKSNIIHRDVPKELIDCYRELLKLKREVKNVRSPKYG